MHALVGSVVLTLESAALLNQTLRSDWRAAASARRLQIWQGIKCLLENYADAIGGIAGKPAP